MSTLQVAPAETRADDPKRQVINDFSIQIATVNGSGSQTANNVLMRSIFQMGIPVSGKNMFPSNIAGLPTWFTIRANKQGFIARKKEIDFLVAMNPETAREDFTKVDPFRVEKMNATAGKIIIEGNAAAALGSMFAGVTVVTWYPITPSSSLVETLIGYLKRFRIDKETGKATYAVVQAEDELASIGMALGAGWAGARSMTSTAGPGISLMSEFVGLGYYAEIPAVIFDVQRVGPSTGLPTRTAQGDLLFTALLSHGDTKHPMLFPSSCEECFTMAMEAFDLSEQFQTPLFVMIDLDLGMNNWMADPFPYPTTPIARGKVLTAEDLDRLGGFGRS